MFNKLMIAGAVALAMTQSAANAAELKLADFLPPTHPYQEKVYGVMGTMIEEATGGEYTLKVFPGGALGGNPVEQYDRALKGVADITFGLPGYTASKFPMTLLTELPGVIDENDATAKVWENIEHIMGEYKRVHLLSFWTNGENVLYTRDKAVRSLADVQGMKVRVPSRNAGQLVESWGAVPISMPVPEVYNAMQTGVIDAILIDSTATYAFKFGEVSNFMTRGMNGSISPFALFMNRDTYDGLSEAHQAEFDRIGREIATIANAVQLAGTAYGVKLFAETEGKEVIELTAEATAEFDAASAGVVAAAIFVDEIVPVDAVKLVVDRESGETREEAVRLEADECNRPNTKFETLAGLAAVMGDGKSVTAGNASQLSDGAAALVVMEAAVAARRGLEPLGALRCFAVAGVAPEEMGIGPVVAIPRLLGRSGLTMDDIDLWEINEAFAAQLVYCRDRLELPSDRLNVNGGAISIGHPYGMSGARMAGHILLEGRRRGARWGVVSMCIGGGQGAAGLIEIF